MFLPQLANEDNPSDTEFPHLSNTNSNDAMQTAL